jgi:hypothetical protein
MPRSLRAGAHDPLRSWNERTTRTDVNVGSELTCPEIVRSVDGPRHASRRAGFPSRECVPQCPIAPIHQGRSWDGLCSGKVHAARCLSDNRRCALYMLRIAAAQVAERSMAKISGEEPIRVEATVAKPCRW